MSYLVFEVKMFISTLRFGNYCNIYHGLFLALFENHKVANGIRKVEI